MLFVVSGKWKVEVSCGWCVSGAWA
jgi:hypothetical protein